MEEKVIERKRKFSSGRENSQVVEKSMSRRENRQTDKKIIK